MSGNYILDDTGRPVLEHDVLKWAKWFKTADRVVAKHKVGDSRISTVFLGIDHNFGPKGPPLLYETMVFGGKLDGEQMRYVTRTTAIAGHRAIALRVAEAGK